MVIKKKNLKLKIEFFFYADLEVKAVNLAIDLSNRGCDVYPLDHTSSDNSKWLICGLTNRMSMKKKQLDQWTKVMCKLANDHNCLFDGWGTLIDQNHVEN